MRTAAAGSTFAFLLHSLIAPNIAVTAVPSENLHASLAQHCSQFDTCDKCSADPSCGFCIDDMKGKCLSGGCSSSNWVGRECRDPQLQCIHAFQDLFPGSSFAEGPCSNVMSNNFKPNSCGGENKCAELASRMLTVCVGEKIPDIPKGRNPNAGKPFTKARSIKMHKAFARAGCAMPKLKQLKATPAPTPVATMSPTHHIDIHHHQKSGAQTSQEAAFESRLANAKKHYVPPTPAPLKELLPAASPQIQAENRQIMAIAVGCGISLVGFIFYKGYQSMQSMKLEAMPTTPRGTEMNGTEEERSHLTYS